MMYTSADLHALKAALDNANRHVPFNTHTGEFVAAAEQLLPHIYRATAALSAAVDTPNADEIREHIFGLLRHRHTQRSIAARVGVPPATICRFLNKRTQSLAPDVIECLGRIPLAPPPPPTLDPALIESLIRGEHPTLPRGRRPDYARAVAVTPGATMEWLARTMKITQAKAIRYLQEAQAV
ncbi:hypothetical protein ACIGO9_28520 [Nocardia asteroides]|uniref:hypothetical protein n=1 Tax=Nocardia asteroides TaxID=1824 RepID=UPI0037C95556